MLPTMKNERFPESTERFETITLWGLALSLLIALALVAYIRVHFLNVPLERDEGEYAYAGQLILQGIPPYGNLYSMKLPGIFVAYAGILGLFGQTQWGIHLGLLIVNMATAAVLVLLGRALVDWTVGMCAGTFFAVLSLSPSVQGIFANAEHFVMLFAVSGLLVMTGGSRVKRPVRLFLAGALFGTACLMKQHGAAFVAFAGLYFLYDRLKTDVEERGPWAGQVAGLALGLVSPLIVTGLGLRMAGVFEQFRFWTLVYAAKYVSSGSYTPTVAELTTIWTTVLGAGPLVWILAAFGPASFLWDEENKRRMVFLGGFTVFSAAAVCPGLIFRPHYFILLLPAVCLMAGAGVGAAGRLAFRIGYGRVGWAIPILIVIPAVAQSMYIHREFYFKTSPAAASRIVYGPNPFPEALRIGEYIGKHANREDRIVVLGSEPEIYFYARRPAATSYVYMYPLMEDHRFALHMQRELIRQIESVSPRFLVFVNVWDSWCDTPQSNRTIFQWAGPYLKQWYEPVGLADMISLRETRYWWGGSGTAYSPQSKAYLAIYQRKNHQ